MREIWMFEEENGFVNIGHMGTFSFQRFKKTATHVAG